MMKQVVLPMLRPGQDPILAGRVEGENARRRLLFALSPVTVPTLVVLEFRPVELATASYLDEVTLKFRTQLERAPAYLVAANLSDKVLDEFEYLLHRAGDAFLVCQRLEGGIASRPRVLGALEAKLKQTYELVKQKGEAGATELHAEFGGEEKVGPTAWNNRLNMLADKGFLLEIPLGRAKKYRPILENT